MENRTDPNAVCSKSLQRSLVAKLSSIIFGSAAPSDRLVLAATTTSFILA